MGTPLEIYTDIYRTYNTKSNKVTKESSETPNIKSKLSKVLIVSMIIEAIHPELAEPFHTCNTHEAFIVSGDLLQKEHRGESFLPILANFKKEGIKRNCFIKYFKINFKVVFK